MPRMRADKVDANQPQVVRELRALGYSVEVGKDDILVGHKGRTFWYELKVGPKSPVKPCQRVLEAHYRGHYRIVWSTEMILEDINKEME